MVKKQKKDSRKSRASKQFNSDCGRARKINTSTEVTTCGEQLSPFGGLLGLVKFLDLFDFKKHFEEDYIAPSRETKLGDYAMVMGIVMLMFIGFNLTRMPFREREFLRQGAQNPRSKAYCLAYVATSLPRRMPGRDASQRSIWVFSEVVAIF